MTNCTSLSRRQFIAASTALLMSHVSFTKTQAAVTDAGINWPEFLASMQSLAETINVRHRPYSEIAVIAKKGQRLMQQLDISEPLFQQAIGESWESGNQFWLWQRLVKQAEMMGGVLNINRAEMVPLHDHPGATGVIRILSGEVEVWQFDLPQKVTDNSEVVLKRTTRRVLRTGDTAVLTPGKGNIHALQALTEDCAMLDFFIPPYQRPQRHWYMPLSSGWKGLQKVICQRISEQDYPYT